MFFFLATTGIAIPPRGSWLDLLNLKQLCTGEEPICMCVFITHDTIITCVLLLNNSVSCSVREPLPKMCVLCLSAFILHVCGRFYHFQEITVLYSIHYMYWDMSIFNLYSHTAGVLCVILQVQICTSYL